MKIVDYSDEISIWLSENGYQNIRCCSYAIIMSLFSKVVFDGDSIYIEPTRVRDKLFNLNVFTEKCFCDTLDFLVKELGFLTISKDEKRYYLTYKAQNQLLGVVR